MRLAEFRARQAQDSVDHSKALMAGIHDLAAKNERETFSIHAITILTLLFLPGTFMTVRGKHFTRVAVNKPHTFLPAPRPDLSLELKYASRVHTSNYLTVFL